MKFCCISDTHNRHKQIQMPSGDVVLHSGDATMGGRESEVMHFLKWYSELNFTHKVFVPGNHDWLFEKQPLRMKQECESRGIILLNDSGVNIEGIEIWGSPVQPRFFNWSFNKDRGEDIDKHWQLIPDSTQILITHGPCDGILDGVYYPDGVTLKEHVGCQDLYKKVMSLPNLKYHVFGHLHSDSGFKNFNNIVFINASMCGETYAIDFPPREFEF